MGSQLLKRSVLLLAATGLFAGAVAVYQSYGSNNDPLIAMELKPTFGPADFNAALAAVDSDLAVSQERVRAHPINGLGMKGWR
ncbi:MAG: hypothetical protein HC870_00575 [Rhizobiales bacterium]|nr:hypothetical protein [Hyphomicrobiales bacterium]